MNQFGLLLKLCLTQALRTRFVLAFVAFGLLTQIAGVNLVSNATLQFNVVVSHVGPKHALFVALFLNLLSGFFLSIVYGTWMIPHAHSGMRGELTFSLPIAKWKFPVAYLVTLLSFLVLQALLLMLTFFLVFGGSVFVGDTLPMGRTFACFALQCSAFAVVAFAFALGAMTFGPILTLFLGASLLFVLQIFGALLRFPVETWLGPNFGFVEKFAAYYRLAPPFGDLVFELRHLYFVGIEKSSEFASLLSVWSGWLLVLMFALWWRIGHPPRFRSSEF